MKPARLWSAAAWFGKTIGPVIVGLAVLVVVIAWLSGAFERKIEPAVEPAAERQYQGEPTDVVHEVTKEYIEEAVGTLRSASRTEISSKVLATIEEITVAAGDQVEKGDLLVRLSSQELEARRTQAEKKLEAAEAVLEEAEESFKRISRLYEKRVVTKSALDSAKRKLEVARADEARAKEALREAEVLLSYATIHASKTGRIVDRLAEPGDTARPGIPLLVLYDAASLRLEAPVLENLAVKLRVGQELEVYVDALGREVEATIDEIVPQADAPSRSFLVKASVPRGEDLYEGMFGRLRIPAGERRHLCLATDAIHRVGQLEFVEVLRDDGTVERRYIKTGRLGIPGRIEVLSGLEAGERVLLQTESPQSPDEDAPGGAAQ